MLRRSLAKMLILILVTVTRKVTNKMTGNHHKIKLLLENYLTIHKFERWEFDRVAAGLTDRGFSS